MNERILVQIIEVILAIVALGGIAIVLAATIYDIRSIARKSRLQTITSGLTKSKQLPVTVLVYTHNDASTIQECLRSITANNYEKYSIIVADNASSDTTRRAVMEYKKTQTAVTITVHSQKLHSSRASVLRAVREKTSKSELFFLIDATDQLSRTALRSAVAHFIADRRLDTLRIRHHIKNDVTIGTLPNYFSELSRNVLYKALAWRRAPYSTVYRSGTATRSLTLSTSNAKRPSSAYSSRITFTARSQCVHSRNSALVHTIIIATILTCIGVISYFFYTAATLRSNTLLTLSWIIVSLWLFTIVWSDELLESSKKIALTFTIPFAYFLFYVRLFIVLSKKIQSLIKAISLPTISFKDIHNALLQEAYSTRF